MTLGCPLCSAPEFPRPGSDFRPPGRAWGPDDGGSMCPGLAGPGGLALEPRAFPAKGISKSRKEGSGEGRKRGREKGWDKPQLE